MALQAATPGITKAGVSSSSDSGVGLSELQSLKQHQMVEKSDLVLAFLFQARYISGGISSDLRGRGVTSCAYYFHVAPFHLVRGLEV